MSDSKYVIFDRHETVLESLLKDAGTVAALGLGVYVSTGSRWWTVVSGAIFVLWLFASAAKASKRRQTFRGKAELQAWANSLPDD